MPLDPSRLAQPFRPCIMPPIVLYFRLLKSSTENPEVLGFNLSKITKMSSDDLFVEGMDICGTIHVHIL